MATNGSQERASRETRLLVLVVVVSLAVLLLLARFRFPAADLAVVPPAPSPLAGLAGRAAFDDLAQTMSTLVGRVASRVVMVELEETPASNGSRGSSRGARSAGADAPPPPRSRVALALRVRPDLALVHVPANWHPVSVVGANSPLDVANVDVQREVALLRLDRLPDYRLDIRADPFAGFTYVGTLQATRGGPSIQPVFVGRVELIADDRWPSGVYAAAGTTAAPGTFAFAIDGKVIGLFMGEGDGAVLVPASVLDAVVADLASTRGSAE